MTIREGGRYLHHSSLHVPFPGLFSHPPYGPSRGPHRTNPVPHMRPWALGGKPQVGLISPRAPLSNPSRAGSTYPATPGRVPYQSDRDAGSPRIARQGCAWRRRISPQCPIWLWQHGFEIQLLECGVGHGSYDQVFGADVPKSPPPFSSSKMPCHENG